MILFATPVYWWGMSAQLKLIIDKCYCRGLQLKNKKVGTIVVGGSPVDSIQYELIDKQFDCMAKYLSWDMLFKTSYCALGMFDSVADHSRHIREIFEESCSSIQMWDNDYEMTHKMPLLCQSINLFQKEYYQHQKPLLMQTVWKTQGKSPQLADQAFDIVIWSDYAFSRLFVDGSDAAATTMSRPMRASARLARCLWELSKSGKIRVVDIYRQMAFGNQTDKEFAIGGSKWRKYVTSDRIVRPILPKTVVHDIIEPGYIQHLSPERRFDQTLYFTVLN